MNFPLKFTKTGIIDFCKLSISAIYTLSIHMILKDIKLKFKFRYMMCIISVYIILSIKYELKHIYFFHSKGRSNIPTLMMEKAVFCVESLFFVK